MFHCKLVSTEISLTGHAGPQAADRQLRRNLRDRAGGGPAMGIPMVQKLTFLWFATSRPRVMYSIFV